MSYKVDTIAPFRKNAKKLIKKYPSLKQELAELGNRLSNNSTAGTPLGIINSPHRLRRYWGIRLAKMSDKRTSCSPLWRGLLAEGFSQFFKMN